MKANLSSTLLGLPGPMKAGIVLVGSGSLIGALMVSGLPMGQLVWILLIGALLVGVLLWLYGAFLKWRERRRAEPMARGLVENVGAAPRGVSDPARRAELADLRKKFEEGLEKFRAAGKNVYSVPWYLFVGEPGSGKTEAVRHCNVPFPPGMQDQLQGAGGTINMDWWFTNHAIIIDTAGKLMFNEVEAAGGPEWGELLKMLKTGRPNCPINGMLLAISAESLITNTADEIERKAGKIAQQFDLVQRTLGVRFPVFVVVTKSDLVNGFREFFDTVEDPQLQHQILGWSNPAPLDSAFNPTEVDKHLRTVQSRLLRNRMWLLHDPVPEDPAGRRIDEVDRLYDFPDALTRIVPRLRRYLELIFVAGEWSPKPLFLRGIYFTSSLREGEALDAVIAEAIGVDVKALPSGKIWERDRAFFLRDLFMDKVFKERGLVTQASNARAQQQKRRATVLGTALASVALLLILVVLSGYWYRAGLSRHMGFWKSMEAVVDPGSLQNFEFGPPAIVRSFDNKTYEYESQAVQIGDGPEIEFASLLPAAREHLETVRPGDAVPFVLKPLGLITGDVLERKRLAALSAVIDRQYLLPLVDAAARKFEMAGQDAQEKWTSRHTEALEQLLLIKRHGTEFTPQATLGEAPKTPQIAPLLRLALGDAMFEDSDKGPGGAGGDPARMQEVIDWIYGVRDDGIDEPLATWDAASARLEQGDERYLSGAIRQGLAQFRRSWGTPGETPDSHLAKLRDLATALQRFETEEDRLLGLCRESSRVATEREAQALARDWQAAWAALDQAASALQNAVEQAFAGRGAARIDQLYDAAVASEMQRVKDQYEPLILAARSVEPMETADELNFEANRLQAELDQMVQQGGARHEPLKTTLTRLEPTFLTPGPDGTTRPYARRLEMYRLARAGLLDEQGALRGPGEALQLSDVATALGAIDDEVGRAVRSVGRIHDAGGAIPRDGQARDTCVCTLQVAQRFRKFSALSGVFAAGDLAGQVEAVAADSGQLRYQPVPLSQGMRESGSFDRKFSPAAAEQVLLAAVAINSQIEGADAQATILDASALRDRFGSLRGQCGQYLRQYVEYWGTDVPQMANPRRFDSWEAFYDDLSVVRDFGPGYVNEALAAMNGQIGEALGLCDRVDALLDEDVRSYVKRVRDVRRREADALASPRFNDLCVEVVRNWRDLGRDAEGARFRLLSELEKGSEEFSTEYLPVYWEADAADANSAAAAGRRSTEYWNALLRRGVEALAGKARQEALQAREWLIENTRKFPLCLGREGSGEMTPAQVNLAWQMIRRIGAGSAVTPAAGTTGGSTGLDLGRGRREMERSLRQLMGSEVILADEQKWFEGLSAMARAVAEHDAAGRGGRDILTCQVRFVDRVKQDELYEELAGAEAAGAGNAVNRYTCFRIEPSGRECVSTRTGEADRVLAAFDVAGTTVRLAFHVRDSLPAAAETTWSRDWNVLGALLSQGAVRVDDFSWLIRISLREAGVSSANYYWVKVTFNRAVPALEQWPHANDWPSPGPRLGT